MKNSIKIPFVSVIPYEFKRIHYELKTSFNLQPHLDSTLVYASRSYPDEWPTLIGQMHIQKVLECILSPRDLLSGKNIAGFSRKF